MPAVARLTIQSSSLKPHRKVSNEVFIQHLSGSRAVANLLVIFGGILPCNVQSKGWATDKMACRSRRHRCAKTVKCSAIEDQNDHLSLIPQYRNHLQAHKRVAQALANFAN